MKNKNFDNKKMNSTRNSINQKDKSLPWWVELLFVQIGLPDKLLVNILKSKKVFKEFIINEKDLIFKFMILFLVFVYFYPVVKQSKNNLKCQSMANNFILKNLNYKNIKNKELRMLSTSFCNGGFELKKSKL